MSMRVLSVFQVCLAMHYLPNGKTILKKAMCSVLQCTQMVVAQINLP